MKVMAHIELPDGLPGITAPVAAYPETGRHVQALAQALLRGPSPLSQAERELIAGRVSEGNSCTFCAMTHNAVATELFGQSCQSIELDQRMEALLAIAEKVRSDARSVSSDDVARARAAGADDHMIHDTVLIAAAFCMFNRYVDGLATWTPDDPALYEQIGKLLVEQGYQGP
jgi:uncharacterized peroxidase-related enzyme